MVGPKESRDFARFLKVRSKTDKIDAKVLYPEFKKVKDSKERNSTIMQAYKKRLLSAGSVCCD